MLWPSTILVSRLMLVLTVVTFAVGTSTTAEAARHDRGARAEISHGSDVPDGTYPFIVALGTFSKAGTFDFFYCGGSLIAPSYVLTAAHCVRGVTPGEIAVLVGQTVFGTNQGEPRSVSAIAIHPEYNSVKGANDVAVLTLNEPVTTITPVQLVAANDGSYETAGTLLTVAGWGPTGKGKHKQRPATRLQQATVPVVSDEECARVWHVKTGKTYIYDPITMCTNAIHGSGDSGGPIFTAAGGTYLEISVMTSAYGRSSKHKVADFGPQLSAPGIRDFIASIAGV